MGAPVPPPFEIHLGIDKAIEKDRGILAQRISASGYFRTDIGRRDVDRCGNM